MFIAGRKLTSEPPEPRQTMLRAAILRNFHAEIGGIIGPFPLAGACPKTWERRHPCRRESPKTTPARMPALPGFPSRGGQAPVTYSVFLKNGISARCWRRLAARAISTAGDRNLKNPGTKLSCVTHFKATTRQPDDDRRRELFRTAFSRVPGRQECGRAFSGPSRDDRSRRGLKCLNWAELCINGPEIALPAKLNFN